MKNMKNSKEVCKAPKANARNTLVHGQRACMEHGLGLSICNKMLVVLISSRWLHQHGLLVQHKLFQSLEQVFKALRLDSRP